MWYGNDKEKSCFFIDFNPLQICLPPQTTEVHWLTFSPVEEHFYRQQYLECSQEAMKVFVWLFLFLSALCASRKVHNITVCSFYHNVIVSQNLLCRLQLCFWVVVMKTIRFWWHLGKVLEMFCTVAKLCIISTQYLNSNVASIIIWGNPLAKFPKSVDDRLQNATIYFFHLFVKRSRASGKGARTCLWGGCGFIVLYDCFFLCPNVK